MAATVARLQAVLSADTRDFDRGMTRSETVMATATKAMVIGVGGVAVGVGVLATKAVSAAADFEKSLNVMQSVSGATGKQMKNVSNLAIRLGNDIRLPGTSAKDASEAMVELSKAGMSVDQVMKAVRPTLVLSAAAGVSNARAAEITSNALNAFGLDASKTTKVVDLLANAANASSVEIEDAADSMQMAGAVFAGFQGPAVGSENALKELATAIGLLGNAGIKGSDAGTSLKQALLQLTGPAAKTKNLMRDLYLEAGKAGESNRLLGVVLGTNKKAADEASVQLEKLYGTTKGAGDIAFDAQGNMRSLKDIIIQVSAATKGMTQEQKAQVLTQIFGADASRAMLVLLRQGVKGWDSMSEAIDKNGAAQDLANAKMKGLRGAQEALSSSLDTLAITIGMDLLPVATKLAVWASEFVSWGAVNWPRFKKYIADAFEDVRPTIQSVIQITTLLAATVEKNWATIQRATEQLRTLVQADLKNINAALQLVVSVLQGDWSLAWRNAGTVATESVKGIVSLMSVQGEVFGALARGMGRAILSGFTDGVTGIGSFFLNDVIGGIKTMLVNQAEGMKASAAGLGKAAFNGIVAGVTGVPAAVWDVVKGIAVTWSDRHETVVGWGTMFGGWLKGAIADGLSAVPTAVWDVLTGIPAFLNSKLDDIAGWGRAIGDAMKDAIVDGFTGLGKAIAQKIKDEAKDLPGRFAGALTGGLIGGTGPWNAGDIVPDTGPVGSGTGPGSLVSSLWDEYALARSMGLSDMGTYNPASVLPSGAPSDHAVYPAKAFDAGISPATGWNNPTGRAFFNAMVGRPGIHYAILGDRIWSTDRGLHGYPYGGHENHVHVSSFDRGGWLQPGWTMAYNGTGRPESVGGAGGVTVYLANNGVLGSEREVVAWIKGAFKRDERRGGGPAFGGGF